jgi:hypothetical protein
MSLISKIKELFAEVETENITPMEFVDVKTTDGMILRISDLAVDGTVVEISENGEMPVEDDTYVLEDGNSIVVVAGVITEVIVAEEVAEEVEMETVNLMDGTPVYFDGELAVGTAIFMDEEMTVPAPDGEHEMEDGSKIVTVTGLVTEMAPAEDVVAVEEEMSAELFMDITLKDGPIAHIVTATEGSINSGDRMLIEQTEVGPGEYETAGGETIVVGEAGVISEVRASESVEEPIGEVAVTEEEEISGVVNNLKNLITQIKDLKSQFDEVKSLVDNLDKENKELKEEVIKFSGKPSAEPTRTTISFKAQTKEEKIKFFGQR